MKLIFKLVTTIHVWLYRSSGGQRGARMAGHDVVLLTTKGRKTGVERTVPVMSFVDGVDRVVVASAGGAPTDPAWFFNLRANPVVTVQLGSDVYAAKAVVVDAQDRTRLWKQIVGEAPQFAAYEKKTSRLIPIVRLVRAA